MLINDVEKNDLEPILALNKVEEMQTSPLDIHRLRELHGDSTHHRAARMDGEIVGFLLAFSPQSAYDSPNFRWFVERYPEFIYIDRIVVDMSRKGMGIGRALYRDLFSVAEARGVGQLACEINVIPPNPASVAFHAKLGFTEVGTFTSPVSGKTVSMQMAPSSAAEE